MQQETKNSNQELKNLQQKNEKLRQNTKNKELAKASKCAEAESLKNC